MASAVPICLAKPALLRRAPQIWDYMTAAMKADVLGASVLDHTAAVDAALVANVPQMVFPGSGRFNVDYMKLRVAGPRQLYCESSGFSKRVQNFVPILTQEFPSTPDYGLFGGLIVDGGTFDQTAKVSGHLIRLTYLEDAFLNGVTVRHRDQAHVEVAADPATDQFTCSGSNPFVNGDIVEVFTNEATDAFPGGVNASTPYTIANVSDATFKLEHAAVPIDVTSTGSGLFICFYSAWGMAIGGRNVRVVTPAVQNGTELKQDGVHLIHGDGISVTGAMVESGDDCFAAGNELDATVAEHSLLNFSFSGTGISHYASLVKAYLLGADYTVKHGSWNVSGSSGLMRNGAIWLEDYHATDAVSDPPLMDDLNVTATVTVGSPQRTHGVNNVLVHAHSARTIVNATITVDGYAMRPYDFSKSVASGHIAISNNFGGLSGSSVGSDTSGLVVT